MKSNDVVDGRFVESLYIQQLQQEVARKLDYLCAMWLMLECHILSWTSVIYKKM